MARHLAHLGLDFLAPITCGGIPPLPVYTSSSIVRCTRRHRACWRPSCARSVAAKRHKLRDGGPAQDQLVGGSEGGKVWL